MNRPRAISDEEWRAKRAAYMREWNAKNRGKSRARALQYARSHKKEAVERVKQWRIKNKEKWLARLRDHYARNTEAKKASNKRYYDKDKKLAYLHKRRARLQSGQVVDCSKKLELLKLERFCRWCCTALTDKNRSIDHVIPVFHGGGHIPDNLVAHLAGNVILQGAKNWWENGSLFRTSSTNGPKFKQPALPDSDETG